MKIQSSDASHVDVAITLVLGSDGSISATGQKVLVDDTTNQSSNVGDAFSITLSQTDQANVNAAIEAALKDAITAAVTAPAAPAVSTDAPAQS